MSKYDLLWQFVKGSGQDNIELSFAQIREILGIDIDHSFLNSKKELLNYGYQVEKISLKEKKVIFNKTEN